MRIFLSYASEDHDTADQVNLALVGKDHAVFFDRRTLPPGGDYLARIETAVAASDLFVFLITPESISVGSFALTELRYAREKWQHPRGRVLPVMVRKVAFAEIPAYLKAVTVLEPEGNIAADVVSAVDAIAGFEGAPELLERPAHNKRTRWIALGVTLIAIAAIFAARLGGPTVDLTLRLKTSPVLAQPVSRPFESPAAPVALNCGEAREIQAYYDVPENASLGKLDLELNRSTGVRELRSAPPLTENNRVSASAFVELPTAGGCTGGSARLILRGTYDIDLGDDIQFQDMSVVIAIDSRQTIQLPKVGIRSIDVIGKMSIAPATPVTLFTVSRSDASAVSADGKVTANFNSTLNQIQIEARR